MKNRVIIIALIFALLTSVAPVAVSQAQEAGEIKATRGLPVYVMPGTPFDVTLKYESKDIVGAIISECLPPGVEIVESSPKYDKKIPFSRGEVPPEVWEQMPTEKKDWLEKYGGNIYQWLKYKKGGIGSGEISFSANYSPKDSLPKLLFCGWMKAVGAEGKYSDFTRGDQIVGIGISDEALLQATSRWARGEIGDEELLEMVALWARTSLPPPWFKVKASAVPRKGPAPLKVTLSATPVGGISPYGPFYWNLGDGTKMSGMSVVHTYSKSGTYVAVVKAKDRIGTVASGSVSINVLAKKPAAPGEVIVGYTEASVLHELRELIAKCKGEVKRVDKVLKFILVKVEEGSERDFIECISESEMVAYAELNCRLEAYHTPNDPKWKNQWGPKKIRADKAWNLETGSKHIVIAIVDSGVDFNHQNIMANYKATGYDYVRNDANPYPDNDNTMPATGNNIDEDGDGRVDEGLSHGTHCAGIAAAVMDNRLGIAGIAQSSIMAVRVLNDDGIGYVANISRGIVYAADNGANIISMSFGGRQKSKTLKNACTYANNKGCLLVAASGNDYLPSVSYPARFETVIAVGAINKKAKRCPFSNFGKELELVAPGKNILSTVVNNGYQSWRGTSMACPHVSGVAALVWSRYPTLSNAGVRRILRNTAVDLGISGKDIFYGYGRVDAYSAVTARLITYGPVRVLYADKGPPKTWTWRHRGPGAKVSTWKFSRLPSSTTDGVVYIRFDAAVTNTFNGGSGYNANVAVTYNGKTKIITLQNIHPEFQEPGNTLGWGYPAYGWVEVPVTQIPATGKLTVNLQRAPGESNHVAVKYDTCTIEWH